MHIILSAFHKNSTFYNLFILIICDLFKNAMLSAVS
jgi:hypothetical protein